MNVAKLAVSFDKSLARAIRRSAGKEPTSAWLADAARRKLRAEGLLSVVREWEAENGEISSLEIKAAEHAGRRRRRKM